MVLKRGGLIAMFDCDAGDLTVVWQHVSNFHQDPNHFGFTAYCDRGKGPMSVGEMQQCQRAWMMVRAVARKGRGRIEFW